MPKTKTISEEFPFESHEVKVLGSHIRYVDEGEGDPILFLHGNPTSSYLWRNIIPHVTPFGRCIAPDLIGMGKSDKPDIGYRFFDHVQYLEEFIKALDLKNITLVVHDWGSALGFHYASRHENNVKALVFMESIISPMKWEEFPNKSYKLGFRLMRTPGVGWFFVSVMNLFLKNLLPSAIVRELTQGEQLRYEEPFRTVKSRRPVRQWPIEVPISGKPQDVHEAVTDYAEWLEITELPKLLFYASPGGIIPPKLVPKLEKLYPNLETIDLGEGVHYLQEDHPHEIGEGIARFLNSCCVEPEELPKAS